jgi:hypothetical protein
VTNAKALDDLDDVDRALRRERRLILAEEVAKHD